MDTISYLIRDIGWCYEVSKWEEWGGKRPEAVYWIGLNPEMWNECSCPGNRMWGHCKHSLMVRVWIADGKPVAIPIVVGLGPLGWGMS